MNKQELMESYTMEELAEFVLSLSEKAENIEHVEKMYAEIAKTRAKYESLKKRHDEFLFKHSDCFSKGEYEAIRSDLERKENEMNQVDYILEKIFGVRHDVGKPDEFEKILQEKAENYKSIAEIIPGEPIKVADMLISAEREYCDDLSKVFGGNTKETYRIFDISGLRQIAEHLIVYCNANKGEEG